MDVLGTTKDGMIRIVIDDDEILVPDVPDNRHRVMIAEWEFNAEGERVNTIPPYVPEPEMPVAYRLFKTTLWLRLSNEDAETVMAAKDQQPAKFRGIWDDAQIIESDSEFFNTLKAFLTATLDAEKAEALLLPET